MKSVKNQNKFIVVALIVIFLVGFFLRVYHFSDWMHFQLDQARDFRVIEAALKYGPGELPLQGPRAAGSFLRLGPFFYYLEYVSAFIFGGTPVGMSVVIMFLSSLSVIVFYYLLKVYFNKETALGITTLFSVSLFMVVYGRFAWNPNLIPFFFIVFVYALLQTNISDNSNERKNGFWFLLAVTAMSFLSQMHFLALVVSPVIAVIYLIWTRPRIKIIYWLLAIAVFIFLNLPLIINDVKTGGQNLREFSKAVLEHSEGKKEHSLADKLLKNIQLQSQYNFLILTGYQKAMPFFSKKELKKCKNDCFERGFWGFVSLIVLFAMYFAWLYLYIHEKDGHKKNFLRVIIIWAVVVFGLDVLLAYDIAPRFFLLNAPLFFMFLALLLEFVKIKNKKYSRLIISLVVIGLILSNLFFLLRYFEELKEASINSHFSLGYRDYILKEKTRVTFSQINRVSEWMQAKNQVNGYPIFLYAQSEYKRAIGVMLESSRIPFVYFDNEDRDFYQKGNYFIILRSQSNQEKILSKYMGDMTVVEKREFGTLVGYYLKVKEGKGLLTNKVIPPKSRDKHYSNGVQKRYLWRQIFE